MANKRPPAPILGYERKQAMLDLIPFTCSWGKMTNRHIQGCGTGQTLNPDLPKTGTGTVASPTIRQDQELSRLSVSITPHLFPPTQDRINGKIRGIMIGPNDDPPRILGKIKNAIWNDLPQFLVLKVMNPDFFRLLFGLPFPSAVFKISDQLFFLGVHRDHRLPLLLKSLCNRINVFKLRIPIRMTAPFSRFGIGLQTVMKMVQQIRYFPIPNPMPLSVQFFRKPSGALAGPSQGRFRVSTRQWFHQGFQISLQGAIARRQSLSPSAGSPDAVAFYRHWRGRRTAQLLHPREDGRSGKAGYRCNNAYAAIG
jgi:hypothetical protein